MYQQIERLVAASGEGRQASLPVSLAALLLLGLAVLGIDSAAAAISCARTVTADVVAIDQPLMFNRLGSQNINGMVFALRRDVVDDSVPPKPLTQGGGANAGHVFLRPDKRPRPLVLRVAAGDCLTVTLTNLLTPAANPRVPPVTPPNGQNPPPTTVGGAPVPTFQNLVIDDQVADRMVSFHVQGMQLTGSIADDASMVGKNTSSLVAPGGSATYQLYAEKEGTFLATSHGATFGSDGTAGNSTNGLFGAVNVEPAGARMYRSQVTDEEMRLATVGTAPTGQPILNYEAVYPATNPDGTASVWAAEGKAGLPILNMLNGNEIVHSDINAVIAGPNADGRFLASTYPLESVGKQNPSLPDRLQPFREYTVVFHDEMAKTNAFEPFFDRSAAAHNPLGHTLQAVGDVFMVNYGSGAIGPEIIANRLGVGPMHDCLGCNAEEFFLTSPVVGDPAMVVDIPANFGLETCKPNADPNGGPTTFTNCGATGPKATRAYYPDDPSNVHHSYISDHVKFRNLHTGKEHHIFHLHNHQWLYNPNDDNANYLDAQAIGPGAGYTYEINFGGSGNRNKSAGDAIFHCHLYPHFAQGMWELWRNHDVFESGTPLQVSGSPTGFHTTPFALQDGMPLLDTTDLTSPRRLRALPDGEIRAGTPIPALVPLPTKAMAPMPGKAYVVDKTQTVPKKDPLTQAVANSLEPAGSVARVDRNDTDVNLVNNTLTPLGNRINPNGLKNPGFPFWIGGVEDSVGQRPPTPPLDMEPNAGGWDGGLPRHTLDGISVSVAAAGSAADALIHNETRFDLSKMCKVAKPIWFPEDGTVVEKAAMAFHAVREHPSTAVKLDGTVVNDVPFVTNGSGRPVAGAPFHEPCMDDNGKVLTAAAGAGNFFDGNGGKTITGSSPFNADTPRVYKGANIQFDAVLNKAGWHYPQERIIALWEDAVPIITKAKAPEPLVMRNNTFDCTMYHHTNLVPNLYEMDDYEVRTSTDIIGQHIHLPKWDLTTTDGSGNGWNYEDGTIAADEVRGRIAAINKFNTLTSTPVVTDVEGHPVYNSANLVTHATPIGATLAATDHPYFGTHTAPGQDWRGARTTLQRWFFDPVVNAEGIHRGLGIIFTHDHFGPSTHQQIGLYATVLVEPAGSTWVHNETGVPLYTRPDGGPTSWQAAIMTGDLDGDSNNDSYREFYLEYTDFQHAYLPGKYVGANQNGAPTFGAAPAEGPTGSFQPPATDPTSYKFAINPPVKDDTALLDPLNLVVYAPTCPLGFPRPCPEGITADDPGTMVVNYRNEPIGLRILDTTTGGQAAGKAGDLAYALQSRTDRRYLVSGASFGTTDPTTSKRGVLNAQPNDAGRTNDSINGTKFPPMLQSKPANMAASPVNAGDPFTPMLRSYYGDRVRLKVQAGGDEETHAVNVHGVKWLQGGSGFGFAPNSGWRNSQIAGISEQFTFASPILPLLGANLDAERRTDHLYTIDASQEGYWNGTWGVFRSYGKGLRGDLVSLPSNPQTNNPIQVQNAVDMNGVCPKVVENNAAKNRNYDISAVLANDVLVNSGGATIPAAVFGTLNSAGGTLVYNPRKTTINPVTIAADPVTGEPARTIAGHAGGILHDPTAILYVMTADLQAKPGVTLPASCMTNGVFDPKKMDCPMSNIQLKPTAPLEPLVLRAAAGDCVKVTLRNRLEAKGAPDVVSYRQMQAVIPRFPDAPDGTVLETNRFRTASDVGLHAGLLAYDVTNSDGTVVGINGVNKTLAEPVNRPATAVDDRIDNYKWYAGDLSLTPAGAQKYTLVATPVEFGGINLMPADKIKQGMKGLVGALVILPAGATWADEINCNNKPARCVLDQVDDHQGGTPGKRNTRLSMTVTKANGTQFRDLVTVFQTGLHQNFGDGKPVEGIASENVLSEDTEDGGFKAINYGAEPLWFRFGLPPNLPLTGPTSFRNVANAHEAYANSLAGGDPAIPVLTAKAGQEFRMHVLEPTGSARGAVFNLHGHVWQRAPYICSGSSYLGLGNACPKTGFFPTLSGFRLGSTEIGLNPMSMYMGGQDSVLPSEHYDIFAPSAGGAGAVPGDYLYKDQAGFGNLGGLWGILRVQ